MPELVLPYTGPETGFVLTHVNCLCPECNRELTRIRGNIYESFGVIEMKMAGVCEHCKVLASCRSRVYPKTGKFAQEKNGRWEMFLLRTPEQIQLRHTLDFLKYSLGGQGIIMALSLLVVKPTMIICIGWGIAVLVSIGCAIWYGKHKANK